MGIAGVGYDASTAADLDQSIAQQFTDHFVGGAALEVGRKFNGAVFPLRGGGQQHKLSAGQVVR